MFEKFRRLLWVMTGVAVIMVTLFLLSKNLSASNGEREVLEIAPEYGKQLPAKSELKERW